MTVDRSQASGFRALSAGGFALLPTLAAFASVAAFADSGVDPLQHTLRTLSVVRPGGGFMGGAGTTKIPLEVILGAEGPAPKITAARVKATLGDISDIENLGDRVMFLYAPPDSTKGRRGEPKGTRSEQFDIQLGFQNGNERSDVLPLEIEPSAPPTLELLVSPTKIEASAPQSVSVSARVIGAGSGEGNGSIALGAAPGKLEQPQLRREGEETIFETDLHPALLPEDAPSHLQVLAVAASPRGYTAKTRGIAAIAPIRISVAIAPGSILSVLGAENHPSPVRAAADGKTVIEDVFVRYGSPLRVFSTRGKKKRELSVAIPAGLIPAGVVAAIPGQNVADGGVGPSIAVAVPPSPFAGEVVWPAIAVDGATLVSTIEVKHDVRSLVLRRPKTPRSVTVLLDGQPVGTIEFVAMRGERLDLQEFSAQRGERGAVVLTITDARGERTDEPRPRAHLADQQVDLQMERLDTGRYRIGIPPLARGAKGSFVEILAEIDAPPSIAGEAFEVVRSILRVALQGAPPPVKRVDASEGPETEIEADLEARAEAGAKAEAEGEIEAQAERPSSGAPSTRFALSASGVVGTTFGSLKLVGGGIYGELRPPLADARFGIRVGAEFIYSTGSGEIGTTASPPDIEGSATVAGVLIPFDACFALFDVEHFELLLRAGAELRIERGVVESGGDTLGGGDRVALSARLTVEGALAIGTGAVTLGGALGGIGASANSLSSPGGTLQGSLTNARAELGYRVWF